MSTDARAMDREISRRISIARYLLICGIVLRHTQPSARIVSVDTPFDFIIAFTHTVMQCTVPMLTCISAYLLFKASYDLKFVHLVKKKTKMILVPLIVWNLPIVVMLYYLQKSGALDHAFKIQAHPFEIWEWLDGTIGLFAPPINYPLNFLRDLFLLCLLSPIFGALARRAPWFGLALVSVIFWFDLEGQFILRDSMAINFFIGAMAAIRGWNLKLLDQYKWHTLALLALLATVCVIHQVEDQRWFRIVAPFLVWPALSIVTNHRISDKLVQLSPASFAIFLIHGPLLLAFWLAYKKAGSALPIEIFWILAPACVIVAGHVFHRAINTSLPGVAKFALGSR